MTMYATPYLAGLPLGGQVVQPASVSVISPFAVSPSAQIGVVPVMTNHPAAMAQLATFAAMPTAPDTSAAMDISARSTTAFMKTAVAGLLKDLTAFLTKHSQQYSQLSDCTALVVHAADLFAAQDYRRALALVHHVFQLIEVLRMQVPDLPAVAIEPLADKEAD